MAIENIGKKQPKIKFPGVSECEILFTLTQTEMLTVTKMDDLSSQM